MNFWFRHCWMSLSIGWIFVLISSVFPKMNMIRSIIFLSTWSSCSIIAFLQQGEDDGPVGNNWNIVDGAFWEDNQWNVLFEVLKNVEYCNINTPTTHFSVDWGHFFTCDFCPDYRNHCLPQCNCCSFIFVLLDFSSEIPFSSSSLLSCLFWEIFWLRLFLLTKSLNSLHPL